MGGVGRDWHSHQVNGVRGQTLGEHTGPGVSLDLRELELCVIGVHVMDLFPSRGP